MPGIHSHLLVVTVLQQGVHQSCLVHRCCSCCPCRFLLLVAVSTSCNGCGVMLLVWPVLLRLWCLPVEHLVHCCAGQGSSCCSLGAAVLARAAMQKGRTSGTAAKRLCGWAQGPVAAVWAANVTQCPWRSCCTGPGSIGVLCKSSNKHISVQVCTLCSMGPGWTCPAVVSCIEPCCSQTCGAVFRKDGTVD